MGGHIAAENSLHIDMRSMNRLIWLDSSAKVVRVQAGMSWRDLLDVIDSHGLSIKVMQSYSNFTVGGSISVNCHGRYVGKGPVVNSVRALELLAADGTVHELSRHQNATPIGFMRAVHTRSRTRLPRSSVALIRSTDSETGFWTSIFPRRKRWRRGAADLGTFEEGAAANGDTPQAGAPACQST